MNCPYPLQAHQIQGLDYEAIYAVVQWLVKTVLTTQEMHGDQVYMNIPVMFAFTYLPVHV